MSRLAPRLCVLMVLFCTVGHAATYRVARESDIDAVSSWFPVGFSVLTHNGKHNVAYYNANREMTVASCDVGQDNWQKKILPTKVGWDSHNYVTLAVDSAGQLHVAGNMHGVPLIYFRTTEPGQVDTLTRTQMVGRDERHCTYPVFFTDADGNLLFMYRSGGSGDGNSVVNRYNVSTKTWSRLLDKPLFDGEGTRNAYPLDPVQGPDGRFHMVWVWRETPDCATNHHLSYARSSDLLNWESAAGVPLSLPLCLGQEATWIDPISVHGGIINGCQQLTFDSDNRPLVSYHKSDAAGIMQIYVARFAEGDWQHHAMTAWDKPISFSGFGSMPFIGIKISGLRKLGGKHFMLDYRHRDYGRGDIVIDEQTLQPTDTHPQIETEYPDDFLEPTSNWPSMQVKIAEDETPAAHAATKYLLRWETLETNQDRPREPPLPPPSRLQLITLAPAVNE